MKVGGSEPLLQPPPLPPPPTAPFSLPPPPPPTVLAVNQQQSASFIAPQQALPSTLNINGASLVSRAVSSIKSGAVAAASSIKSGAKSLGRAVMPNEHRIEKMKDFFKPGEKTEWGIKQLKSLNPFGRNAWGVGWE